MTSDALIPLHTGRQVRDAEAPLLDAGHGPGLMSRAAHGLALTVLRTLRERTGRVYGTTVTGLIGPGNNGGDGLFALAALRRRGVDARAVLLRDRAHAEGLAAFRAAGGRIDETVVRVADVVVDAIIGTGTSGGFSLPEVRGLAEALSRTSTAVIACDVPSGVDPDTGAVAGEAVRADVTVTFGGTKLGLAVGEGAQLCGTVVPVDIGLGDHLAEVAERSARRRMLVVADPMPGGPDARDHKYSRGTAQVVAGSPRYPGAAALTVGAAVRTGCGMVALHASGPILDRTIARHPEVVGADHDISERVRAAAVGPGIGDDPGQVAALHRCLDWAERTGGRLILDASALGLLRDRVAAPPLPVGTLLTPHLGEMRALLRAAGRTDLLDSLESDPVTAVESLACHLGCTLLLKGPSTIIAAPAAETLIHRTSAPGLATAGSGDVLTGILAASAATAPARVTTARLAASAVHRHAQAAHRLDPEGRGRFGASSLIGALGPAGEVSAGR
ncbi:MAG: NAD(P)H-hydrate dehydratase [Nesterenkonia sp.]|nr:NAD(P)H-hydrate dehydratase [Nesterenkonia sp.]